MNWFRRVMYGRNGPDHLSLAIILLGLMISMISYLIPVPFVQNILRGVDYLLLVAAFYRILSRNVQKRQRENAKFVAALAKIGGPLKLRVRMLRERGSYKYLKCPDCGQRLRAPRGRGKILITCQKCHTQFQQTV